jgi:hypothetical protein
VQFIEEVTHQIERYDKGLKQSGVLPYIPRFAILAARMEQLVQGTAREAVDTAYDRLVSITAMTVFRRLGCGGSWLSPVALSFGFWGL